MARLEDPWEPETVRNMDVVGMVERIDRYAFDIMAFESSSLNEITTYDLERIQSYNEALRVYGSTINSSPVMDLPHSYPHMYQITYITKEMDIANVKNKAIRDIIRMYVNNWVNWARSESADRANGWHPGDYSRFIIIMDRLDVFIQSYIGATLPLDLPKSSSFENQVMGV